MLNKVIHKLFKCPTFWKPWKWYKCPRCQKTLTCYWDGNDVVGHGADYCNKCADELENKTK